MTTPPDDTQTGEAIPPDEIEAQESLDGALDKLRQAFASHPARMVMVAESAMIRFVGRASELLMTARLPTRQPIVNVLQEAGRLLSQLVGTPDKQIVITVTLEPRTATGWTTTPYTPEPTHTETNAELVARLLPGYVECGIGDAEVIPANDGRRAIWRSKSSGKWVQGVVWQTHDAGEYIWVRKADQADGVPL